MKSSWKLFEEEHRLNWTFQDLLCHALADSGVLDQTSHLAGDPLHALLGLHEGEAHVLDAVHDAGSRVI